MKGTEQFESALNAFIQAKASKDKHFAEKVANPSKNIKDCVKYVIGEVFRQNRNGFDDDEVYGMALHYYDEENVTIGKLPNSLRIVTNQGEQVKENSEKTPSKEPYVRPKKVAKKEAPANQYTMF